MSNYLSMEKLIVKTNKEEKSDKKNIIALTVIFTSRNSFD